MGRPAAYKNFRLAQGVGDHLHLLS
jgi:hypothetical protein